MDYLQRIASSDAGREYKSLAMRELAIRRADTVVDLGCGPGTDLREFAAATGADGSVIGLDCDADAIAAAAEAVADYPWVQARKADVHMTFLPDGRAERVHADRVVRNATVGRALVRLARRAGFASCRAIPVTSVFTDVRAADEVLGLKRVTDRAVAAQYLDRGTATRWLDYLADEPFLASVTMFVVIADS